MAEKYAGQITGDLNKPGATIWDGTKDVSILKSKDWTNVESNSMNVDMSSQPEALVDKDYTLMIGYPTTITIPGGNLKPVMNELENIQGRLTSINSALFIVLVAFILILWRIK